MTRSSSGLFAPGRDLNLINAAIAIFAPGGDGDFKIFRR
jgi:hypothetical protein